MVVEYPVKKGTIVHEKIYERGGIERAEDWMFEKQYPHHALFKNKYGIRRCFTNAELYTKGVVMQGGKMVGTPSRKGKRNRSC